MDELKIRRMQKCAESPEGHIFGKPINGVSLCHKCELTIEEIVAEPLRLRMV